MSQTKLTATPAFVNASTHNLSTMDSDGWTPVVGKKARRAAPSGRESKEFEKDAKRPRVHQFDGRFAGPSVVPPHPSMLPMPPAALLDGMVEVDSSDCAS